MSLDDSDSNYKKRSYTGIIVAGFLMSVVAVVAGLMATNAIPVLFQIKEETNETQLFFNQSQLAMEQNRAAANVSRVVTNETRDMVTDLREQVFSYIDKQNNTTHKILFGLNEALNRQEIQIGFLKNDSAKDDILIAKLENESQIKVKLLNKLENESKQKEQLLRNQEKVLAYLSFIANQTLYIEKGQQNITLENNAMLKKFGAENNAIARAMATVLGLNVTNIINDYYALQKKNLTSTPFG